MLTQICIRDLATIEKLQLDLMNGNTMITGETGAGKSVFLEAIEIGLGSRASHNLIRSGKEKAEISLCFDVTNFKNVLERLDTHDLLIETKECIIRRIITLDGRSRCYINGTPVTVNFIKELGELLFHMHGQHEQQVLLKAETQREMLDRYANHLPLTHTIKLLAEQWREMNTLISHLESQNKTREQKIEFLNFQLNELLSLDLKPNEWEQLEIEHHRLTHSEKIITNINLLITYLSVNESSNIFSLMNEVRKNLESLLPLESKASTWLESFHTANIHLNDLESELQNYLTDFELDPEHLNRLEERMSRLYNIARKYKTEPQLLLQLQDDIFKQLQTLNSSDEELKQLRMQLKKVEQDYAASASKLTQQRQAAAKNLSKTITQTIRSLSLPHGEFSIIIEKNEKNLFSVYGADKIIYLIKTNPDQQLLPLNKVISGGELSRLSLALHLALADRTCIPTLIFDEVDTGLSGATAEKIGKLLRKLGESYQVFCITHQAQVAAYGHHHLLVEKKIVAKTTHTHLRLLSPTDKAKEIARMLGGEKITAKTLAHAQEVLASV